MTDRRELALVAVERTRMPMVVSDPNQPDNPIVLAHHAFLDLTGYSATEVIGRNCRFLQGPDTAPADIDRLRQALARGNDHIELELLNYRKDGSTFWNQLAISSVRNAEGQLLYHFASQKDVSARRAAEALEANEHRLLMEVDHRAMNALALVQSIVNLTRSDTNEGLLHAIRRRVGALARAHRLLASQSWQGVEMHDLARTQIDEDTGQRVSLDGQLVQLAPHAAQPLALALHELFSNAQLHGALSGKNGRVQLSWCPSKTALRLRWNEREVDYDETTVTNKLGLTLVRDVVENQLKGRLTRMIQEAELVVAIDVPDVVQCEGD
ncbi:MAG: signal transduction histidine kinase [Cypionkella sp.]|uniref:PAS domain-containing protein n=1 Tax=Cypionkella sp. TaxID=2811411 RepID=UPI00261FBB5A|nr:PAS domain-containing protein [Cypionkella sp.]MDB5660828.1 signal transduction histidine kinase [Cypionkella sp.]